MLLLVTYVLIALVFSFLCSVAEAVLLSVRRPYILLLQREGHRSGALLARLKNEINKPLAAILTLNTIAHTIGAAGAGAQAAAVFGNAYLGVASAVLTLLILVFSEIIPKTLGAHYWRQLAPVTAYGLHWLVRLLYPFVLLSKVLTRGLSHGPNLTGFSRDELIVMADVSAKEGQLGKRESGILKNLLRLRKTHVKDVMTPRTVVFSLPESLRVEEFFWKYEAIRFSRIPIYSHDPEHLGGFVLRSDLLLAQARGNTDTLLATYRRDLQAVPETSTLLQAFEIFLRDHLHMMVVVNEYGETEGVVTLEDVIETLLGLEIVDESDKTEDLQALARRLWRKRARGMGIDAGE